MKGYCPIGGAEKRGLISECGVAGLRTLGRVQNGAHAETSLLAYWPRRSLSALVAKPGVTGRIRALLHVQAHCNNSSLQTQ